MKLKPITKEIRRLVRIWKKDGFEPHEINNGCCDGFADQLEFKFPMGSMLWGEDVPWCFENMNPENVGTHCFFCYENKYYDSECENGVDSPEFLPFYIRAKEWYDNKIKSGIKPTVLDFIENS